MQQIKATHLNLGLSVFSGQAFDWEYERKSNCYCGDLLGDFASVRYDATGKELFFTGTTKEKIVKFFDLDENYGAILNSIKKADPKLYSDSKKYFGLRILRQDPWKAAVTFVCSQNNNIPRIRKILGALKEKYGKENSKNKAKSFPAPAKLAKAKIADLRKIGLGYRAEYIHSLAKNVASGKLDFAQLQKMDYEDAFVHLVDNQHGIGPKVADCLLLYGLEKMEAFPTDVWVRKAVERRYGKELREYTECQQCRAKEVPYQIIGSFARRKFGKNAGYAQQFLFLCERNLENKRRKW
ncbi:MAG: DNA glycosylase [Candidatus Micrarchaeia archaeon]|jgi:N-glycosylase/DNA lyase